MKNELTLFYLFLKNINSYYDNQLIEPQKIEDFEDNCIQEWEGDFSYFKSAVEKLSTITDYSENNKQEYLEARVNLNMGLVRLEETFHDAYELFSESMQSMGRLEKNKDTHTHNE